ncbi:hypothetical protein BG011_009661 [Mortierella polycephala]|uniref:Nucleolar 27S pre-rRNA processing Urb2/Npa2 C-terminal domain-containing protein n=1 Tax=Mortierella polycephala TaxID=41804 RepID=A0A9P6PMZ7_9FUNG|nr:hypothetical protein BG011_009661 [Mortierella polycephala]
MEEYLSSSEAFAKALKGLQTSPSEKIRLAKEAWERNDVVLPHKKEFLLEWLCSALVKASTPSKNPKDNTSNTIQDLEYWSLFKTMLSGIADGRKKSKKYRMVDARSHTGHPATGADLADNQAPSVLLRVPVIPMFTALVQRFAPHSQSTAVAALSKPGKKSKLPETSQSPAAIPSESPSVAVLEAACFSFDIISGPHMSEWFQPTLEQYTPLVQATLEALVEMVQDTSNVDSSKQEVIMTLAHIVLDRFKRLAVIQPNQKKVFGLVAGKMFEALVRARVAIRKVPGTLSTQCQEAIGAILRTGLFHQEHLQEYTSGYTGGDEKSIQSYQKQLFEQVSLLTKSEHSIAVLDVLPVLLRYFVEESRRKHRSLASSGFDRGLDSARETEFSFFKIIYVLAKKQLPQLTEEPSESSLGQLVNIMDALNNLLSTILDLNMYQPSNNEAADQYVFMSTSFGSIYSCLTTAQTLSNGRLQSTSLTGIVVLSQLDDRLLKPHLDSLWPVLLCPLQEARDAVLELLKTLLEIYGKSSDLKVFMTSLLTSLRGFVTRPAELQSSPIFSRAFLDIIPSNIKNYLPLPQAPIILDIFVTELMTLDSNMEIDSLEPILDNGHKKKRKLNSGKSKGNAGESSGIRSAELVVSIFIQFLKGLRVTTNQEKQLNKEFKVIYDHFLRQIFEQLVESNKHDEVVRSETYQSRRLTPALRLHYALCKVSTQYWSNSMTLELVSRIVGTFKGAPGWSDAAVLVLNRVVLQHVHLTLCTAERMDEDLTEKCKDLVRFTMKASRLKRLLDESSLVSEAWDGRLETATASRFMVASWQIQVNDWLDIVCRFGTTQHMELIAEVIAKQFSNPASSEVVLMEGSITIHLLNQILLRSANFYEVPNFRPIFAQKILQGLAESITALSETEAEKSLAATVSLFTSQDSSKDSATKTSFTDALKELVEVTTQQPGKGNSRSKSKSGTKDTARRPSAAAEEHGPRLLSLLSIMHLLPLEYFEKYERNIILTTMAILDLYIQRHLVADATGVKCLLLERRISNAIMTWRSDAGVLFNDPAILLNLIRYATWSCSTTYGSEDKDGLGRAVLETTCAMTDSATRYYMTQAHDAIQRETAHAHLDALLQTALGWATDSLERSNTPPDGQMTDARIAVILLSRVCQSLVYCIEQQQHRKSKSKSRSKSTSRAGSGATNGVNEMDKANESANKQIEKLFNIVQIMVNRRIKEVMAHLGSNRDKDKLVEEGQKCMDHFELYRTTVLYQRLSDREKPKSEYLDMVPDLFLLSKALAQTIVDMSGHQQQAQKQSLVHLVAILTGYSCEYLPLSKSWESIDVASKSLKELLMLLLGVSGQDLQEKEIVLLKDAYLSMLGLLSDDLFEKLLHWFLDEVHSYGQGNAIDELVLVRYLDVTFLGTQHIHKRKVRRQISKLLTRLTQILQSTQSVQVVVSVMDVIAGICSESSFELRSWEIGLALEAVTSLMSPATPLLLSGAIKSGHTRALTNQDTSKIFMALYHVLINVARFRQEELTTLIPIFTAILQGIFHGFKSLHGSIAKRQQGVESLIKSPFMLLSSGAIHPIGNDQSATPTTHSALPIGDPLPVDCAENFARLLTALGSKGVSSFGGYGGSSGSVEGPPTNSAGAGSFSITTDASKAFGKHAPYILMEYFTIQSSVMASISQQSLRNALLPGLYALLNLCSDWEREMMMVGLDNTGKLLLKGLYADYLKYHKYTGR